VPIFNTSKTSNQIIIKSYSKGISLNFVKTFKFWITLDINNKNLTPGMKQLWAQRHLGDYIFYCGAPKIFGS